MKSLKILFILSIFILGACNEFEDLNLNPNEPMDISSDVLLASGIRESITTLMTESFLLGNNAAQLTAKTLRNEVDIYNWNAFPTVWEGLYGSLTNIIQVENQSVKEGNEVMEGVAIVYRSYIFSVLTNAYGAIPYSEAISGAQNNNFTPVYDEQEAIYSDILSELARAEGLLASGSGSIGGDILLGNDATLWRKFANSLRLRLLMTAGNQLGDAGTRFSSIVSAGNIITSNSDNVALGFLESFPNQFPTVPLKTGDFDAVALSQTSYTVMDGYGDPRLARYARPDNDDYTAPAFTGAENGSGACDKNGSRLGAQYFNDPSQTTAAELGLGSPAGLIMTYAEVEFLLAEAAAKGWITNDVETHYQNGIEASMDYYQVDYAPFGYTDFNDYYTNSGVAYTATTDIWEQKWLALFFHGLEPYFEVRRWYFESGNSFAGIPFLGPTCENTNNDELPFRFLYPGEEQSLNQANYEDAIGRLPGGSDDINAPIWLVE